MQKYAIWYIDEKLEEVEALDVAEAMKIAIDNLHIESPRFGIKKLNKVV